MRIFQINTFGNLSTGRIATDLHKALSDLGHESEFAFARNDTNADIQTYRIGSEFDVYYHGIMTRITDKMGFYSKRSTKKLIQRIEEYSPDIIHLHNLHGYYINIELLFNYLKKAQIPVVWTIHDCWPFTGHCCFYSAAGCSKWQSGCSNCIQKKSYPSSIFADNSEWNYQKKKELFNGANITLVPVSQWLGKELEKSFLNGYPVRVIQNGIDTSVFKPVEGDFREKNNLGNKKLILTVAASWNEPRKGLTDVIRLSEMLDDSYRIVVVGVTENEKKLLGSKMIGINRTDSVQELAEIYTTADVFFNASVEETFGMTTIEAMACGTPVIVYDSTAIPEVVTEESGFVVEPHNLNAVVECIKKAEVLDRDKIIENGLKYSRSNMMNKYLKVYNFVEKSEWNTKAEMII